MGEIFGNDEAHLMKIGAYITAKEIRQQPRLWKETLEIIENNKARIQGFLDTVLKEKDLRIIFTGAGTSCYVGDTVTPYLDKKLLGKVESIATTDIVTNPENYLDSDIPTLLISCARSGNSPESVATVELAEKLVDNLYQIFLTCNPEGKLAQKALQDEKNLLILMPEDSNDQGFAMTGSFTCMSLASLLIFNIEKIEDLESDIKVIIELGEKVLEENVELLKNIAAKNFNRVIYLGSSTMKGLAREAALKILELTSGQVMSSSESFLGFRHGPKSVINDKTIVFVFLSNDKYTKKYEVDLLKEMAEERDNKKVIAVSNYRDVEVEKLVDHLICIDENNRYYNDDVYLAFDYILNAQMFALFKSMQLGVCPDNPSPSGTVNRVVKGVVIYPYENIYQEK